MHVAIVIPAFNIAAFVTDAIKSVLAQTHPHWSLVVVDDGSTDLTASVAAGFHDPRIRVIRQGNNGVSAARNCGAASFERWHVGATDGTATQPGVLISQPDAFLFLDGDDWLAPHALTNLVGALAGAPGAVAACAAYVRVAQDGRTHMSAARSGGCQLGALLTRNLFANGGHVLIRRRALEATGGFRCDLSYGEDWEFWVRLALLGEFASVRSRQPALYVRERPGSAYLSKATNPEHYRPVIEAIYANPALLARLSHSHLDRLRRRAGAEIAWTIGRELVRHGEIRAGRRWLTRALWEFPSLKRFGLIGLSWSRVGPFRRYQTVA